MSIPWTRGIVVLLLAATALLYPSEGMVLDQRGLSPEGAKPFLMISAIALRDFPGMVRRYATRRDYVRVESLPSRRALGIPRARRYVLPATLRAEHANEPGIRAWLDRGCGPNSPGTIVYDPEHWELTPQPEQRHLLRAIHRAARVVAASGCHDFGLAADSVFMFGMDAQACSYLLDKGLYRAMPWEAVDIVDIQGQRLLSDRCGEHLGVDDYQAVVSTIASFVRRRNPAIKVVSQVSFRYTAPGRMSRAIASVGADVDGIYFSYPSTNPDAPCIYCSRTRLQALFQSLRV